MAERGYECVLKMGGTTIGIARNVDPSMSAAEMDITTRSSGGWRETMTGLKQLEFTAELLWVPTSSALQAIETAFLTNSTMAFQILDDTGWGWTGNCVITEFKPGAQGLEDAVACSITAKSTGAVSKATGSGS